MAVGRWLVRSGPYFIIRRHFGIFYAMLAWRAGLRGSAGDFFSHAVVGQRLAQTTNMKPPLKTNRRSLPRFLLNLGHITAGGIRFGKRYLPSTGLRGVFFWLILVRLRPYPHGKFCRINHSPANRNPPQSDKTHHWVENVGGLAKFFGKE